MSVSLRQGDQHTLESYATTLIENMQRRYESHLVAEKWISHPRLNDFLAWRVRRSKYLQDGLREFLIRGGDARSVYSPLSIIRSFWK